MGCFWDKIQGVLRGIDAKVDTENIVSCNGLKRNGNEKREKSH